MRSERPSLSVGDRCRLLYDTSLYDVVVTEVHVHLAGEPSEFTMYRVKTDGHPFSFIVDDSHHRSNLFLLTETKELIAEIESRVDALEYLKKELETDDPSY